MTKKEVIDIIAKNRLVEGIISNIGGNADDLLHDLSQDIYIDLLAKDEDKIVNLYENNQIKFFVTRMVINNIHSKNSPYWCKYKRFTNNMEELGDYADGD